MEWEAYARFEDKHGTVLQTQTQIRMKPGTPLGVVYMINPGAIRQPLASRGWKQTLMGPTLSGITQIIAVAYDRKGIPLPEDSYFEIKNLVDYPDSQLERLKNKLPEISFKIKTFKKLIPRAPWVWIAWGSERNDARLKKLMLRASSYLPKEKIIGYKIQNEEIGYYHPRFIQMNKQVKNSIIEQIMVRIAS